MGDNPKKTPVSERIIYEYCSVCECDIPRTEFLDHEEKCRRFDPCLACDVCGHSGFTEKAGVNRHHKNKHHGKKLRAPGCKNIFIRAAVPGSTERFGGKVVCGAGLQEKDIRRHVSRLRMHYQAGGLFKFQQSLKEAASNRSKLYSLADRIRAWCISAHNNDHEVAAPELANLGLSVNIGKGFLFHEIMRTNIYFSIFIETPQFGEVHGHPVIAQQERRFHHLLARSLRELADPKPFLRKQHKCLSDYDMDVICKRIGYERPERFAGRENPSDEDNATEDDEGKWRRPLVEWYLFNGVIP